MNPKGPSHCLEHKWLLASFPHSEVRAEKMCVKGNSMLLDVGLDDTSVVENCLLVSSQNQLYSAVTHACGDFFPRLGSHLPNLGGQGGRHSVYIFNFSKVYEAEVGVGEVHLLQRVRMTRKMVSLHF